MLLKIIKAVNPLHLFVLLTLFGLLVYIIITYKSLIIFQQDVNRMKHQINSLTNTFQTMFSFQEEMPQSYKGHDEKNTSDQVKTPENMDGGDEKTQTVEYVEENENLNDSKELEKSEKSAKSEKSEGFKESEESDESKESKESRESKALSEIKESKEEEGIKDDDNDSVTSLDIKQIMDRMLNDSDNDQDCGHKDSKENRENKEKEKMVNVNELKDQQIEEEPMNDVMTFVQNHDQEKKEKKQKNVKKQDNMVIDKKEIEELNTMKYEELRQHLRLTYHESFAKGTKADLIARILICQENHL